MTPYRYRGKKLYRLFEIFIYTADFIYFLFKNRYFIPQNAHFNSGKISTFLRNHEG